MAEGTSAVLAAPAAAPAVVAAPAGTAPVAAPETVAVAPPAVPATWLDGADELTTGYIANKGWKGPLEVVKSYTNLETLLGADRAGRTVVMPGPDATPAELSAFYTKLGRPEKAEDYQLPVAEGSTPEFASAAAAKFHELGIPKKAGVALTEWLQSAAGEHTKAQATAAATAFAADDAALKTEWGGAFDQKLAAARAAKNGLGLDDASINKMSASLGHKATMNLLANIGAKTSEHGFVAGEGTTQAGGALTPAMAKDKIQALRKDADFSKRYLAGGVAEKAEMARLQSYAFPPVPK